jgi:hypothetical protein
MIYYIVGILGILPAVLWMGENILIFLPGGLLSGFIGNWLDRESRRSDESNPSLVLLPFILSFIFSALVVIWLTIFI